MHVPKVMQHERQHHFHVEAWLLCMILIQLSINLNPLEYNVIYIPEVCF